MTKRHSVSTLTTGMPIAASARTQACVDSRKRTYDLVALQALLTRGCFAGRRTFVQYNTCSSRVLDRGLATRRFPAFHADARKPIGPNTGGN